MPSGHDYAVNLGRGVRADLLFIDDVMHPFAVRPPCADVDGARVEQLAGKLCNAISWYLACVPRDETSEPWTGKRDALGEFFGRAESEREEVVLRDAVSADEVRVH